MLIRPISDLHLEFSQGMMDLSELPTDKETVLVLAGDIGIAHRPSTYKYFIEDYAYRFKHVIVILGNHEHYHGKFPVSHTKIWNELVEFDNVSVLEKECEVIDGVAFVCATLWTDMYKHNPICMYEATLGMNDYGCIRTGPNAEPWKRKLKPQDTIADHLNAKHYIFEEIKKQKEQGNKVVVVTHHAPCELSVDPQYKSDILTGCYYSDLSNEILDTTPELWIHGHTHVSFDYELGDTRVICNPRGYMGLSENDLNHEFNPELLVEV